VSAVVVVAVDKRF